MKSLNVIGCGNVGRTLARLWAQRGLVDIRSILNRSLQSAEDAVDFVGNGRAVERFDQLDHADLIMMAVSDESIESVCEQLCRTDALGPNVVLFHCSGSLPSALLAQARTHGASVAGLHPIKSFADPESALVTFEGTYCAVEGDEVACGVIGDLLRSCGAIPLAVDPARKAVYHSATVFVCNYLTALMEVGLRCFEQSGVDRAAALRAIRPMVEGTVANVFRLGPAGALTGPIARGEPSVVQAECDALEAWDPRIGQIYKDLGRIALELSAEAGVASSHALTTIRNRLRE